MIKDKGLASLFPGVRDEEEEQLQAQAKEAVMKRLNVQPTTFFHHGCHCVHSRCS